MKTRLFIATFAFVALSTLANAQTISPSLPYDEAQTKSAMEIGNTTIEGTLYSRINASGKDAGILDRISKNKIADNQKVSIFPITPYFAQYLELVKNNKGAVSIDERFFKNAYYTQTDANGHFEFPKMKEGKYYLYAERQLAGKSLVHKTTGADIYFGGLSAKTKYEMVPEYWNGLGVFAQTVEIKPNETVKKVDARLLLKK